MNIAMILRHIRPGSQWSMSGNDFETLNWLDQGEAPSYQEVLEAWPQVESEIYNQSMEKLRQEAYRNESDPLFFQYQRGDVEKSVWLEKVQEIKDRFPYSAFSQE